MAEKYHALIINWKLIFENDIDAKIQYVVVNDGLSSAYLDVDTIDEYRPRTKYEWEKLDVDEKVAEFLTEREFEPILDLYYED